MATSVTQGEMMSMIISHWFDNMTYLTGPDKLPMLQSVSHCETNGISLGSIKSKVENAHYDTLEEFIKEFLILLEFEKEDLNRNMNSEIKTAKGGIKSITKESKSQIYAAYGLFILEQYLEDWKSKTLGEVEKKNTTIEELYQTLVRKKERSNFNAKSSKTSKFPEENPRRVSKRISAALKTNDKSKDSLTLIERNQGVSESETEPVLPEPEVTPPQPCSSYDLEPTSTDEYETSDEELNIPILDVEPDILQKGMRSSPSSDLLIKIPMNTLDIGNEEIQMSPDEQEYFDEPSIEIFEQVSFERSTGTIVTPKIKPGMQSNTKFYSCQNNETVRCENIDLNRAQSEPVQYKNANFQSPLSNQSQNKNVTSYHSEDPFEEISSVNLDQISDEETPEISSVKRVIKRKRKIFFKTGTKRSRREKRILLYNREKERSSKKVKTAEININTNNKNKIPEIVCFADKTDDNEITENINNRNDKKDEDLENNNKDDNNDSIEISKEKPSIITPEDITTPPQTSKPKKRKFSPIIYDLSDTAPQKPPPTSINTYRSPPSNMSIQNKFSPPIHGGYYFTPPQKPPSQYFPRYPYTTYPPVHHAPLHRFYARQRIPSFSMIHRQFPSQVRPRHSHTPNSNYLHSQQRYFH